MTDKVCNTANEQSTRPALSLVDKVGGGAHRPDAAGGHQQPGLGHPTELSELEANPGKEVITDFDDGIDAIDFMIQAFGFDDPGQLLSADTKTDDKRPAQIRLLDPHA